MSSFNSNISVISAKTSRTSLSSILKTYTPSEREKAKTAIINKVRFEMPKQKGILEVVKAVEERQHFEPMNEFVTFLTENQLDVSLLMISVQILNYNYEYFIFILGQ